MTESPQAALALIPGWENASWRELSGGLSNRTWLVSTGARKAVLKIDSAPRVAPYNDRLAERNIQRIAENAALANRVLYASETLYLTEFIEGEVWEAADLDNKKNLGALAKLLRRVHSLPLTGRRFNAIDAARRYVEKIDTNKSAMTQRCVDTVQKLHAPQSLCCCHNDLVAANIIATPELRLLDWEYACDNDPFFDLATVVAHHELSGSQAGFFLDQYLDGDGERWRDKLEQQMTLYRALLWLWCASRAEPDHGRLLALEARLP